MVRLGVVLGGGGPLGSGWYAGLGQGLVEAGFDFAGVNVFIGTSGGAVAGAWWASGRPSSDFAGALISAGRGIHRSRRWPESMAIDFDLVARIYGLLGQATAPLTPSVCRQVCELASAVPPRDDDEDWNVNGLKK